MKVIRVFNLLKAVVIVAGLLWLAGCAQTGKNTSGIERGHAELVTDVDHCNMEVFGTADYGQIRRDIVDWYNQPHKNAHQDLTRGWEQFDECLEKSGWALRTM
jgi:hypothetical protein